MIFLPSIVAQLFLSQWFSAIGRVSVLTVAIVVGLGFLWGIGSVAFAIGIESVGLSLGYALIMGVVTSVGSIIPMLRKWESIPIDAKLTILLGIIVCLVGVALCGKAGILRDRGTRSVSVGSKGNPSPAARPMTSGLGIGLGWCVLSGVLSACNNIGFDFASPIAGELQRMGTNVLVASLVQWVPVFWGGYLAVLIFSGSAMIKNGTWKKFAEAGTRYDFIRAVCLGALSFLALVFYGMGASSLGALGTTVGYGVFLSLSIVVALVFGFMIGEWRGATKRSVTTLYLGMGTLIAAVAILAFGNSLVL